MNTPFLIKWKTDEELCGTAIVMASTATKAWDKYIKCWKEELGTGIADIEPNEVVSFTVEVAADEFYE